MKMAPLSLYAAYISLHIKARLSKFGLTNPNLSMTVIRRDDALWKSVLETIFAEFLLFFYPDAKKLFDFSKGFVYLDKEFDLLFPPEEGKKGIRFVDKLVKVFLRDGSEKFVLVHVEVQSQKGKNDLEARMFNYWYLVRDKYKVPVTAIAILADGNKNYRPKIYVEEFLRTRLTYEFDTYKIIDQDEASLRANPNPFSVVVLTSLLAIRNRNLGDDRLKSMKHNLYAEMMNRRMTREKRKGIYDFLTYFVLFQNPEMFRIFEKELLENKGKSVTMGTQEYLLDKAEKKGLEKGKREEQARAKKLLAEERTKAEAEMLEEKRNIAREFKKLGVPIADIAKGTGLSIEEIEKL